MDGYVVTVQIFYQCLSGYGVKEIEATSLLYEGLIVLHSTLSTMRTSVLQKIIIQKKKIIIYNENPTINIYLIM